jgi:hypothetical protein
VLFAFDNMSFKGGQNATRGIISGGDVGVNAIDPDPTDSDVPLDICANQHVTMDPGSQVNADSMRISDLCTVWDVYANSTTNGSNVVPQNSGPTAFSTPLLANLPSFPSFSCDPSHDVDVEKNDSATIPPGSYGEIFLEDGSNTTLQPGTYDVCRFRVGKNADGHDGPRGHAARDDDLDRE